MRRGIRLAIGVLGALLMLGACGPREPLEAEAAAEQAGASDAVVLEPERAEPFVTAVAEAAEAPAELHAMGRVLDPSVLLEASGALASARVAAAAAELELTRTQTLASDHQNASERELAAARLAAVQARAALGQAEVRALASWGTSDAERVARLAEPLARGELAVARIELPAGEAGGPTGEIQVSAPALGLAEREARLIGPAGALDASLQSPALLVAIAPSPPPPGAALEARVSRGAPLRGVWLPAAAVVWNQGEPCAFVPTDDTTFTRRALAIARPLREGYLVTAGVEPGERVVTSGAQQLLSAQLVGGGEEEE